jgi:hypothetical protein
VDARESETPTRTTAKSSGIQDSLPDKHRFGTEQPGPYTKPAGVAILPRQNSPF